MGSNNTQCLIKFALRYGITSTILHICRAKNGGEIQMILARRVHMYSMCLVWVPLINYWIRYNNTGAPGNFENITSTVKAVIDMSP